MTTKTKKIPKLRFPEFSDEWKEKKVDEFMETTRGQVLAVLR